MTVEDMLLSHAHSGLDGQAVRLTIGPESWGLPLERLAHRLAQALDKEAPEPVWTRLGDGGLSRRQKPRDLRRACRRDRAGRLGLCR